MNRLLTRFAALFLLLILLCSLSSCSSQLAVPETAAIETATQALAETKAPQVTAEVEPDQKYYCADDSVLSTYKKRSKEDFDLACAHFEKEGYTLYSSLENSGIFAKTYTKGSSLAHLYYHPVNKELNLVQSQTASDTLPPAMPAGSDGKFPCTVTQLNQHPIEVNGMGYVIQLTDGSFIIYDGGYSASAEELLDALSDLAGGEKPVVRAWVLTHLHDDHTQVFKALAARKNPEELLTLEHVIYSPVPLNHPGVNEAEEENTKRLSSMRKTLARFPDAKVVYAHTGMKFTFCNLEMEILYTPESLYKNLRAPEGFNNSSILSRLRDENGSILFTGDIAALGSNLSVRLYGDSLASDMVQMSHHGVESCPLAFYEKVQANTLWYPCSYSLYASDRNKALRDAVAAFPTTKEILIAGHGRATRPFPTGN